LSLTIDGRKVEVEKGCTILRAARSLGIDIPTMCYYEPLGPATTCMVCLVKVEGQAGLVPACSTHAADGMVVNSRSDEVRAARRRALELLLSDHLGDCMAPCHRLCPAGMNIPLMIRRIAAGRFDDALETVKRRIALPGVLGRICPAPCEKGCRRGRHDSPVAICLLKRFAADRAMMSARRAAPVRAGGSGKRAAVVGAGPAGLSAAYYLRRMGHGVTVYDDRARPGGALWDAAAEGRLPPDVLDAETEAIHNLGVAFRQGARVGTDMSLDALRQEFDAVLIATGEPRSGGQGLEGLETADGRIVIDRNTYAAGAPGVFAAGAAVRRFKRLAVRACADGREAAESIDQYLAGRPVTGPDRPLSVHVGALREGEMEKFLAGAAPAGRVEPSGGQRLGFSPDEAVAEARRCLHCDCRKPVACRLRRYAREYQADLGRYKSSRRLFEQDSTHAAVVYEPGKCISCGTCVRICRKAGEALGLTWIGRGFDVRVGAPLGENLAAGLTKAAEQCVAACPTGALAFKDDNRNDYGP